MSKFSESTDVGPAPQIQFAWSVEVVETLVNCDSACNEQSLKLPTYYEWEMAENHEAPDPLIWISTVSGKDENSPALVQFTFDELESSCSKPELRNKEDGPAFSPCTRLKPDNNLVQDASFSFLVFGFDYLPDTVTSKELMACVSDYRAFCISTHDHKCFGNLNCYRLVVKIAESIDAIQYKTVVTEFAKRFGSIVSTVGSSNLLETEMIHFPSCPVNQAHEFEFVTNDGEALDCYQLIDARGNQ